jgi:hypothetical protein
VKRSYCVYFNETKEQFCCAKTERVRRFGLLLITEYLTENTAKEEASQLNRNLEHWREQIKER